MDVVDLGGGAVGGGIGLDDIEMRPSKVTYDHENKVPAKRDDEDIYTGLTVIGSILGAESFGSNPDTALALRALAYVLETNIPKSLKDEPDMNAAVAQVRETAKAAIRRAREDQRLSMTAGTATGVNASTNS